MLFQIIVFVVVSAILLIGAISFLPQWIASGKASNASTELLGNFVKQVKLYKANTGGTYNNINVQSLGLKWQGDENESKSYDPGQSLSLNDSNGDGKITLTINGVTYSGITYVDPADGSTKDAAAGMQVYLSSAIPGYLFSVANNDGKTAYVEVAKASEVDALAAEKFEEKIHQNGDILSVINGSDGKTDGIFDIEID